MAGTAVSPYRQLRSKLGITRYRPDEFMTKLQAAGFVPEGLPFNIEHNEARMTFRAQPKPGII